MKKKRKPRKVDLNVWEVALCYLRDHSGALLDEHTSLITGFIRARDVSRLATLSEVLGYCYSEPGANRILSQLSAFVKKNESFSDEDRCFEAARKSFFEAEELCSLTNDRLVSFYRREPRIVGEEAEMLSFINRVRFYIRKLCGDRSVFLDSLPKGCKVTSGATRSLPRSQSLAYQKVRKRGQGTSGGTRLFRLLQSHIGMKQWPLEVVEGNRIALVPKSYKTHRTIAAEPEINMFFQTSVDYYFKNRLLKNGIDLRDQSRNKELAREGSISNRLATIDLSMASDTMALEVIPFLFPNEWSELFETLRSPVYTGPFGDGTYTKFSSMGNGYTFVLETIIFWAVAKASNSETVSVYGDDIIVDSTVYSTVVKVLEFLGFIPNQDKSYHTGPFRESCGGDYFKGVDIRPTFIKKSDALTKPQLCHVLNGLIESAGDNLLRVITRLIKKHRLPLVPVNEDTHSGVFLSKGKSHELKLISLRNGIPYFKGYTVRNITHKVTDVRTLILWFLTKVTNEADVCTVSDVVRYSTVRYSNVRWQIPNEQPTTIDWWSEEIVRAISSH